MGISKPVLIVALLLHPESEFTKTTGCLQKTFESPRMFLSTSFSIFPFECAFIVGLPTTPARLESGSPRLRGEWVSVPCRGKGCIWWINRSSGRALAICLTHWASLCAPQLHTNSFHYQATPLVFKSAEHSSRLHRQRKTADTCVERGAGTKPVGFSGCSLSWRTEDVLKD